MRNCLLVFFLGIIFIPMFSQNNWAPVGTEWYYGLREDWQNTGEGYRKLIVESDSIFGNDTVRLIKVNDLTLQKEFEQRNQIIAKHYSNKVFYHANERFHVLYNFDLDSGDTYMVRIPYEHYNMPLGKDTMLLAQVDSVGKTIIGGDTIDYQKITCVNVKDSSRSDWQFVNPVYNRIGGGYFLPRLQEGYNLNIPINLRCFSDTDKNWSFRNLSCDSIVVDKFENPSWLMPLVFEDATGAKDTVFLGYDERASFASFTIDSMFNEFFYPFDTSRFTAFLLAGFNNYSVNCNNNYPEPVKKINVFGGLVSSCMSFFNAKMPVTLTWNDSLLDSPELPFSDISPRPRARLDMFCARNFSCPDDDVLHILTNYDVPGHYDVVKDSFVFEDSGMPKCSTMINMYISVFPHDYQYAAISEKSDPGISIYPNPFRDKLNILLDTYEPVEYVLSNTYGNICLSGKVIGSFELETNGLLQGLYILEISSASFQKSFKILKISE